MWSPVALLPLTEPERNEEYCGYVRSHPCLMRGSDCQGEMHAHHYGKGGEARLLGLHDGAALLVAPHRMLSPPRTPAGHERSCHPPPFP